MRELRDRLRRMFRIMLEDNVKARVQLPDGSYEHVRAAGRGRTTEFTGIFL